MNETEAASTNISQAQGNPIVKSAYKKTVFVAALAGVLHLVVSAASAQEKLDRTVLPIAEPKRK